METNCEDPGMDFQVTSPIKLYGQSLMPKSAQYA